MTVCEGNPPFDSELWCTRHAIYRCGFCSMENIARLKQELAESRAALDAMRQERERLQGLLRELVRRVDLSNAVDYHGHELKHLKVLANARAVLAPSDPAKERNS